MSASRSKFGPSTGARPHLPWGQHREVGQEGVGTAQAIDLTEDALECCRRQGDRHRQAALENNLADLLQAAGRPDEAMAHLKGAVALFAEIGGRPGELEPEIWKLVEW